MRILHTESSNGWGGQEIRILKEAEGMRQNGHDVVLAVTKGGKLIEKAREKGFQVYEIDMRRWAAVPTFFSLRRIIKDHDIQIINTHSSWDAWIGGITARLLGKKIVRTRHLSTKVKPGLNSRLLYGFLADFVVTTSSSIIPMIASQAKIPEKRCRCIPTGVDPSTITADPEEIKKFRSTLGIAQDDFLVGTACFVRSWKGIKDLLQAANLLRDVPRLKWVVIGGGYVEEYKPIAKELGLEKIVFFTGHLESPYAAIASLDLFTLLSTAHEGISQASLQAAFFERPLLTTTIGGLPEVCQDGITGLLVPPFAPEKIAEKVSFLMDNKGLRESMGKKARELVLEKFTLQKTLEDMEEVYFGLLKPK